MHPNRKEILLVETYHQGPNYNTTLGSRADDSITEVGTKINWEFNFILGYICPHTESDISVAD